MPLLVLEPFKPPNVVNGSIGVHDNRVLDAGRGSRRSATCPASLMPNPMTSEPPRLGSFCAAIAARHETPGPFLRIAVSPKPVTSPEALMRDAHRVAATGAHRLR